MGERFFQERGLSNDSLKVTAYQSAVCFFEFCLSIRSIIDLLYRSGHQNVLLDAYLQGVNPETDDSHPEEYYIKNFVAHGLYGLINAWILRGYHETPQEMGKIAAQLLKLESVWKIPATPQES